MRKESPFTFVLVRGQTHAFSAGFTLVEVTLAIGILSFSLLVMLGLMPVGLTTMRNAMNSTVETQILRQIDSELLLASHSRLAEIASGVPRYFDDEGQEQSALASDTCYILTLNLKDSVFPGAANADASSLSGSLATIQVILARAPGGTVRAENKSYYNLTVPNSGN